VYNAALGVSGEDGSLARLCERFGVRQQAAPAAAAYRTWYKPLAAEQVRAAGFKTPPRVVVSAASPGDITTLGVRLHETYGNSFVVKPAASSFRAAVRRTETITELSAAVAEILAEHDQCVIEVYIPGQAVTIMSVPGLRGARLYHAPIMTWTQDFLIEPDTPEVLVPATIGKSMKQSVYDLLEHIYPLLGLQGAVKTDLVIGDDNEVYFLEVNSLASLESGSAMEQSFAEVAVRPDELIGHQLATLK
jgi:D-alanine-D-alanine ligase-like ATP-grasp enzyme